jgi:endonuclease YncB( thermonuclease family)
VRLPELRHDAVAGNTPRRSLEAEPLLAKNMPNACGQRGAGRFYASCGIGDIGHVSPSSRKGAALSTVSAAWALAGDLVGQASIIDSDTLEIHGTRVRLWGIDAPESTQLCRGEELTLSTGLAGSSRKAVL